MLINVLQLLSSLAAAAEPAMPPCALTPVRVCDYFKAHAGEAFIELPDGTFTPNPIYRRPKPADPEYTSSVDAPATETSFQGEEVMGELMEILDVPALSTRAKLMLSMNIQEVLSPGSEQIELPWPLEAARPAKTGVDQTEGLSRLKNAIGADRFARLRSFVSKTENQMEIEASRKAFRESNAEVRLKRLKHEFLASDPKRRATREQRVRELFRQAKASVVSVITGDKPRGQLNEEQLNLLRRIEPIEGKFLAPAAAENNNLCRDYAFNSFQDREQNEVQICPGVLWEPDAKLVGVFAHELCHPIDPCAVQNDLVKYNPAAARRLIKSGKLSEGVTANLNEIITKGHKYLSVIDAQYLDEPAVRRQLDQSGAVSALVPRLKEMPDLYKAAYACLAQKYQFRAPTSAQREALLRQSHQNLDDYAAAGEFAIKAADARLRSYVEAHPDCPVARSSDQNQMNEIICDMFGDIAREKFVAQNPPRSEAERMISFVNGAGACEKTGVTPKDLNPVDALMYQSENAKRMNDAHPPDWKRVQLEVDLPGLAAAAGCVREEAGCFDHLSLIKKAGTTGATGAGR